jgi:hypothetical protein
MCVWAVAGPTGDAAAGRLGWLHCRVLQDSRLEEHRNGTNINHQSTPQRSYATKFDRARPTPRTDTPFLQTTLEPPLPPPHKKGPRCRLPRALPGVPSPHCRRESWAVVASLSCTRFGSYLLAFITNPSTSQAGRRPSHLPNPPNQPGLQLPNQLGQPDPPMPRRWSSSPPTATLGSQTCWACQTRGARWCTSWTRRVICYRFALR